jgi:hypothetical protein
MAAKKDPSALSTGQRIAASAVALVALVLLGIQQYLPVVVTSALPACVKAADGCVVESSRAIDPALSVALLALFAFTSLIAATGRLWKLDSPFAKAEPFVPAPANAPETKKAKAAAAKSTATVVDALPQSARRAADKQWREWFGVPLADSFVADAGTVDGERYFTATPPNVSEPQVYKLN